MTRDSRVFTLPRAALAGFCLAVSIFFLTGPVSGATRLQERGQTLGTDVGQRVMEALELSETEDWTAAEQIYDALLTRQTLSAYERATVLKLRGSVRYELDQPGEAAADFAEAVALGVLPPDDANTLRINAGQLLMMDDQVDAGIQLIEEAIALGVPLNADLAMRLAQGYAQIERLSAGLSYARQTLDLADPPERNHFSMLLFYLQSLEMDEEQLALIGQMVDRWPAEKRLWSSYASLLARLERERDAFDVNTIMYLNGMLTESQELVRLAQYYSWFGYPYRGAVILEREINSGRVETDPDNFVLLANLWREAREWDRALPVLRRVATMTGAGPDFETLGEALYQNAEFVEAEAMFRQALRQGGLTRPGDTWTFIGNSLVEQDRLDDAMHAFRQALDWEYSRASAQGWIDFIEHRWAIDAFQQSLEDRLGIEECGIVVERERRAVPTAETRFGSDGRRLFDLSDRCETYFDVYGNLREAYQPI